MCNCKTDNFYCCFEEIKARNFIAALSTMFPKRCLMFRWSRVTDSATIKYTAAIFDSKIDYSNYSPKSKNLLTAIAIRIWIFIRLSGKHEFICFVSVNVAQAGYSSKISTVIRKIGKLRICTLWFLSSYDVIEIWKPILIVVVKLGWFS